MATKDELQAQLEKAQSDIATLAQMTGQKLASGVGEVEQRVEEHIESLSEEAQAMVEAARNQGQQVRELAEDQIKQNPLAALAVAVGAGFLLAHLLRR